MRARRLLCVLVIGSAVVTGPGCIRWYKRAGIMAAVGATGGVVIRESADNATGATSAWAIGGAAFGLAFWGLLELAILKAEADAARAREDAWLEGFSGYDGGGGGGGGGYDDGGGAVVYDPVVPARPESYTYTIGEDAGTVLSAGAGERVVSASGRVLSERSGQRACMNAKLHAYNSLVNSCHNRGGDRDYIRQYVAYATQCQCQYDGYHGWHGCEVNVRGVCSESTRTKALFGAAFSDDVQRASDLALHSARSRCSEHGASVTSASLFGCECDDLGCACYADAHCALP